MYRIILCKYKRYFANITFQSFKKAKFANDFIIVNIKIRLVIIQKRNNSKREKYDCKKRETKYITSCCHVFFNHKKDKQA